MEIRTGSGDGEVVGFAGGDRGRQSCQGPQCVLWTLGSQVMRGRREVLGRRCAGATLTNGL